MAVETEIQNIIKRLNDYEQYKKYVDNIKARKEKKEKERKIDAYKQMKWAINKMLVRSQNDR